jgi:peptidoglycan/LPS O-acetylase OafA/YrhL
MGAARRYADIQVLRAIACLMVILHHVSITHTTLRTLPGELESPFWMGVELFFVISGFVVTRSLLGKNTSAVAFLLRRFFRLTPAIIAFLAFSLCTFLLIGWFALVTRKLIKQHNDIYPLLYAMEEADKKKERGES